MPSVAKVIALLLTFKMCGKLQNMLLTNGFVNYHSSFMHIIAINRKEKDLSFNPSAQPGKQA